MKKLLALLLAICLVLGLTAAFAEEDEDLVTYTMEHPEAKVFCSTWVADNGDRRIEVYDEDGGLKLYIVHKLGDNKEDIWEYAAVLDANDSSVLTAVRSLSFRTVRPSFTARIAWMAVCKST